MCVVVLASVVLMSICLVARTAWQVRHPARSAPAPADAIVVFGAAVHDGRPCHELRARLRHAALLHAEGWAPRVLCSGGPDEVDAMRTALARWIDEGSVDVDPGGISTRETIGRLAPTGRVLLVSSPWHVHRIAAEARRRGIDAVACPAATSPVAHVRSEHRRQVVREIAACWWYAVSRA